MFTRFKSVAYVGFLAASLVFTSCQEDEPLPAPTITLPTSSASATAASTVKITASINAPAGLKSVVLLKNGQPVDTRNMTGEVALDYAFDYQVESLPVGSVVTFILQATDNEGQTSAVATFTVTISALPAKEIVTVEGNLSGNIRWTADKIYRLKGFVRIGRDENTAGTAISQTGVLTIEPGTVIVGERATKGTLIIHRGSRIIAEGTVDKPIIMTSERNPGEREPGDWGGLVICGKARNNNPGGVAELEGQYGAFHGGTDENDNSGSLRYVRVEYAGVPINPNQEVNSFTFGSVGKATKMEYLQATFGLDDSFEWFGGNVDGKYLVAFRSLDDDFDVDNGFTGNIQFGLSVRGASLADQSGSNGFEVDNDGQGTFAEPFTAPNFANITIVGPKERSETPISLQFQNGMHLRRNTRIKIYNTVVTGYPNGVYIDPGNSGRTLANAANGDLILRGVVVAGIEGFGTNGFGQGTSQNPRGFAVRDVNTAATPEAYQIGNQTPTAWFSAQPGNRILTSLAGTGLNNAAVLAGSGFTLAANGSLLTGSVPVPASLTQVPYIGAFDASNDWTRNWTNFNPAVTNYR